MKNFMNAAKSNYDSFVSNPMELFSKADNTNEKLEKSAVASVDGPSPDEAKIEEINAIQKLKLEFSKKVTSGIKDGY